MIQEQHFLNAAPEHYYQLKAIAMPHRIAISRADSLAPDLPTGVSNPAKFARPAFGVEDFIQSITISFEAAEICRHVNVIQFFEMNSRFVAERRETKFNNFSHSIQNELSALCYSQNKQS
jgi:hypothetical protein